MLLVVEGEPQKTAAGALCTMLLLQVLPPLSFVAELVVVRVVAAHTTRLLLIFGLTVQRISDLPCRRIHRRALAEALTVLETDWMLEAIRTC